MSGEKVLHKAMGLRWSLALCRESKLQRVNKGKRSETFKKKKGQGSSEESNWETPGGR